MEGSKYSIKIIKFIDDNLKELNDLIDPIVKDSNNELFKDISTLITSTYKKNYNYQFNRYGLFQIHKINQYPLLFTFLCKLYKLGTLDNIVGTSTNICNFARFVEWYRENHTFIDLESIHNYINELDQKEDDDLFKLYYLIYKTRGYRSNLHDLLYNNKFVSLDVQHHAESTNMIKYVCNTTEFNLTIYHPDTKSKMLLDVNKIIHIIKFMNELGRLNNPANIPNVCIFAGLQRKQLSGTSNNILCPDNINSGSSVRGQLVKIWRVEELYKVLIHELVHFHKLDFNHYSNNYGSLSRYLINTYNIKGTDSPNESYTETLAVIIHSLFVSFYHKYKIEDILRYEIAFTLFQVSKILKFFSIKRIEDLGYKPINQTTSVFSYFIVKGSLLVSLPLFLDYVKYDIKNLSIEDKVESFEKLIKLCMSKQYFKLIGRVINLIDNIKIDKNCFVMKTLRMTCFQL